MAAIAVELATAYVSIVPSAKGFGKALEGELGGAGSSAGDAASKSFGAKFTGGMAGIGKVAGAGLGIGLVAAAGIGKALFDMGASFDDAYDKIRTGTGATGDELLGLQADLKAVSTAVPTSFEDASTAITDLNKRLGLTGVPLQNLAGQFLDLSRVTGTDLTTNVDTLTRVFGDWGVATEDQAGTLDKVFRASQESGIGIDALGQSVVQFGAPLRNLGFGFDESVALLAKFSKEGVNTETVFAGMKAGVGKLAKAGEDVPATFRRVVDEITKLGPGTEATAKSIELFGQRAGPDLADAIAGGKFEVGGMLDAITNGSDTITQAGADTADFGEKLQMLKNEALIKLEPIALRVFGAIGDAVERVAPLAREIAGGFVAAFAAFQDGGNDITSSGLAGAMESIGIKVRDAFDRIGPLVTTFIDQIRSVDWAQLFGDLAAIMGPIVDSFVDLAVAVGEFAVDHWPKVAALFPVIKDVAEFLGPVLATSVGFLADNMNILGPALLAVGAAFLTIKAGEASAAKFDAIKTAVTGASDKVKHLNSNFDQFLTKSKSIATSAKSGASSALDTIRLKAMYAGDKLKSAATAAGNFGTKIKTAVVDKATAAASALQSAGKKALELGKSMVTAAIAVARNTAAWVANRIATAAAAVATAAQTIATTIATAATAAFNFVLALNPITLVVIAIVALIAILVLAYTKVDWFREFVDKAFNAIKDVITSAITIAWQVIQTVFEAIKTVITTYVNIWKFIITTAFNVIKFVITNAIEGAKTVISNVFDGIKFVISNVIDGIKAVVSVGFDILKALLIDPIFAAKDKVSEIFDGIKALFSKLPDDLKAGLSSLASTIAAPFKAMGQAIKDAWNNSVGGKGFDIPDIAGVPNRGERVEIPTLHTGGLVPGRPGQEVLRILEAGELVSSRKQVAAMKANGQTWSPGVGAAGAGGGQTINVATVANANADEVVDAINAKLGWAHTARRDR